jgi:hypothetical protein
MLEYCNLSEVITREQHYLDTLKPEYNALKTAGSLLGFKHRAETKEIIRRKSKNKTISAET